MFAVTKLAAAATVMIMCQVSFALPHSSVQTYEWQGHNGVQGSFVVEGLVTQQAIWNTAAPIYEAVIADSINVHVSRVEVSATAISKSRRLQSASQIEVLFSVMCEGNDNCKKVHKAVSDFKPENLARIINQINTHGKQIGFNSNVVIDASAVTIADPVFVDIIIPKKCATGYARADKTQTRMQFILAGGAVCKDEDGCLGGGAKCSKFSTTGCHDRAAPKTGFTCGPCPKNGFTGDGIKCTSTICNPSSQSGPRAGPCGWDATACVDLTDDLKSITKSSKRYKCTCKRGYTEIDGICVNARLSTNCAKKCASQAKCLYINSNKQGGSKCYCGIGLTSDDGGQTCDDVDACLQKPCFKGVSCTDLKAPSAGYTCKHPKTGNECPPGWTPAGKGKCKDIDDCTVNGKYACGDKNVGHSCKDTGTLSHSCTCSSARSGNTGYANSGNTCVKETKCNSFQKQTCDAKAVCGATPNSNEFKCVCPAGDSSFGDKQVYSGKGVKSQDYTLKKYGCRKKLLEKSSNQTTKYANKDIKACTALCSAQGSKCKGFGYGVEYGTSAPEDTLISTRYDAESGKVRKITVKGLRGSVFHLVGSSSASHNVFELNELQLIDTNGVRIEKRAEISYLINPVRGAISLMTDGKTYASGGAFVLWTPVAQFKQKPLVQLKFSSEVTLKEVRLYTTNIQSFGTDATVIVSGQPMYTQVAKDSYCTSYKSVPGYSTMPPAPSSYGNDYAKWCMETCYKAYKASPTVYGKGFYTRKSDRSCRCAKNTCQSGMVTSNGCCDAYTISTGAKTAVKSLCSGANVHILGSGASSQKKYFHSNHDEGKGMSWGSKVDNINWKLEWDGDLKSGSAVHLYGNGLNKYFHSNAGEGQGMSWGSKSNAVGWRLEWDGSLTSGKEVFLKGTSGAGSGYFASNHAEGRGMSWGGKSSQYAWKLEWGSSDTNCPAKVKAKDCILSTSADISSEGQGCDGKTNNLDFYTKRTADDGCKDFNACSKTPCFQGVECLDTKAPGSGFKCMGGCPLKNGKKVYEESGTGLAWICYSRKNDCQTGDTRNGEPGCKLKQVCAAGQADLDSNSSTACSNCAAGKYSAKGSTACIECVANTADTDSDAASPCTRCGAGKYSAKGATSCTLYGGVCSFGTLIAIAQRTQDKHCGSCDIGYDLSSKSCVAYGGTCTGGSLIALASRTQNNHCGSCSKGRFLSNKVCTTWNVCSSGEYETKGPTTTSDRSCSTHAAACSAGRTCARGEYEGYDQGSYHGDVCRQGDISGPWTCPSGCTETQPRSKAPYCVVADSTAACRRSSEYESKAPTSTSDRECQGAGSCTNGALIAQADRTQANHCAKCNAGYKLSSKACLACQAGKFTSSLSSKSICHSCPAGKTSAQGAASCTNCAAGKISSVGTNPCASCAQGKYASAGSTVCTSCPQNYYDGDKNPATACTACSAGKLTTGTGNTVCNAWGGQCTQGSLIAESLRRQTNHCGSCNSGYRLQNRVCVAWGGSCSNGNLIGQSSRTKQNHCASCNSGYFLTGTTCTLWNTCSSNEYETQTPSGTRDRTCGSHAAQCNANNQYQSKAPTASSDRECRGAGSCPNGNLIAFSSRTQANQCGSCSSPYYLSSKSCVGCPSGKTWTGNACTACAVGKFSSNYACVKCSLGRETTSAGSTTCANCPTGKYGKDPNWQNTRGCENCPAGKYTQYTAQNSISACSNCAAGKYGWPGVTQCTSCPVGKYSGSAAATSCTNCPSGKQATSAGSTSCSTPPPPPAPPPPSPTGGYYGTSYKVWNGQVAKTGCTDVIGSRNGGRSSSGHFSPTYWWHSKSSINLDGTNYDMSKLEDCKRVCSAFKGLCGGFHFIASGEGAGKCTDFILPRSSHTMQSGGKAGCGGIPPFYQLL